MKVKELMSKKFPHLHPYDSIDEAIKKIIKIPESALPVINKNGKIVGELSQKELLLIDIGDKEYKDESLGIEAIKVLLSKQAKKVKDLMNEHSLTVLENDEVLYAAKIMYDESLSTLPVVDKKGKLVGIVTDIDILKQYKKLK